MLETDFSNNFFLRRNHKKDEISWKLIFNFFAVDFLSFSVWLSNCFFKSVEMKRTGFFINIFLLFNLFSYSARQKRNVWIIWQAIWVVHCEQSIWVELTCDLNEMCGMSGREHSQFHIDWKYRQILHIYIYGGPLANKLNFAPLSLQVQQLAVWAVIVYGSFSSTIGKNEIILNNLYHN